MESLSIPTTAITATTIATATTADEPPVMPLDEIATTLCITFIDKTGAPRNFDEGVIAYPHSTPAGQYEAVFNRSLHYLNHYQLTGEYGVAVGLMAPIGVSSGIRQFDLITTEGLPPEEVSKLVAKTRKTGSTAPTVVSLPGFVHFARAGRSKSATFSLELVLIERTVCVRSVCLNLAADDASHIVSRLALRQAQMRG